MINKVNLIRVVMCAALCVPLSGCAATVGQQFRDIMAAIDVQCRIDKKGPYLDPSDPDSVKKRRYTDCDILKIKPADPLATEEGRFAYAIRLPPPHDKPKVQYQAGMSAESYFKELCEKEAGEWIFRTVEGVEGVFQGRRQEPFPSGYSSLIFHTREFLDGLASEEAMIQPYQGHYNFFEKLTDKGEGHEPYVRFFRGAVNTNKYKVGYPSGRTETDGRWIYLPYIVNSEQTVALKSRYGYTSRQIGDKSAVENAIVGSELIVYDLATNEVLAFRRSFVRHWPRPDSRYTRLTNSEGCRPGFTDVWPRFIEKALVPINVAE